MKKLKFFFMLALLLTAVAPGAWADNGWSVWDGETTSKPNCSWLSDDTSRPTVQINTAAEFAYIKANWFEKLYVQLILISYL